jgi:hypothetical protein
MCNFISWIEKDNNVLFLTSEDIFHTQRGKELQNYTTPDDFVGHGAIRWFFNCAGGENRECEDFSTPANFPDEIVRAFKLGKFRGLGIAKEVLILSALAEYEKVQQSAIAKVDKSRQEAWIECERVRQTILIKYKTNNLTWMEYKKICDTEWIEYKKLQKPVWDEYEQVTQSTFWDLFSNLNNRVEIWR